MTQPGKVRRLSPKVDERAIVTGWLVPNVDSQPATSQNASGSDSSDSGGVACDSSFAGANAQNALHSEECTASEDDPGEDDGNEFEETGWRVAVNVAKGVWRLERFSGATREYTSYRQMSSLPGGDERLNYAKQNSERQKATKSAARVRRG